MRIFLPLVAHAQETVISNPIATSSITGLIANIVNAVIAVTGVLALFIFIWGGFQYLFSRGDSKQTEKAKETLKWGVAGIAVIMLAYTGVSTIVTLLEGEAATNTAGLTNVLGTVDIRVVIGRVIDVILGLAGSVSLLIFMWGGFQYLTAAGDPSKASKGKDTIKFGVLGLTVIILSYTLITTVVNLISSGTAG